MKSLAASWQLWALASAGFAALTAVLAKVGVAGVNPDYATFVRTVVIVAMAAMIVTLTGQWRPLNAVEPRALTFLALSGLATGASWLCYFRALQIGEASRVAPLDKLSVVFVAVFAALFLGERLDVRGWLGVGLIALGAVLLAWRAR